VTDADLEMHAPGPLARACTRLLRYLPYVGMVTIIMNDYPMFKCAQPPLTQPHRGISQQTQLSRAAWLRRWFDELFRPNGAHCQRIALLCLKLLSFFCGITQSHAEIFAAPTLAFTRPPR